MDTNFYEVIDPNAKPITYTVTYTNAYTDANGNFHSDCWTEQYTYPNNSGGAQTNADDTENRLGRNVGVGDELALDA